MTVTDENSRIRGSESVSQKSGSATLVPTSLWRHFGIKVVAEGSAAVATVPRPLSGSALGVLFQVSSHSAEPVFVNV